MTIAFRVDASSIIGTGHVMRCLTLANALKKHQRKTLFLSRHMPDYLIDSIQQAGHVFVPLTDAVQATDSLAHAKWLGTSQQADAQECLRYVSAVTLEWLIIDHYGLSSDWEVYMRAAAPQILAIDDLADRMHDCDILLDQNAYPHAQTRYAEKLPAKCRPLLGAEYALLREEFVCARDSLMRRVGSVQRILVSFGGADSQNWTAKVLNALIELNVKAEIDVVIGAQHPAFEDITQQCATYGFHCHVQSDRMAQLMAAADMAIGAGGVSVWERASMGLPSLTIAVAENQIASVEHAAQMGMIYTPKQDQTLQDAIQEFIENPALRAQCSETSLRMVDAQGTKRVVDEMGLITFRLANSEDEDALLEWRNHESIRAASHNNGIIAPQEHHKWLENVLADENRVLLIGLVNEQPIGVVRFDMQEDSALVSLYTLPHVYGRGNALLQTAELWICTHYPHINRLTADALTDNAAAHRYLAKAGYHKDDNGYSKAVGGI
ncbi:MAG: UDP-2,4-diacetamido-2,4,6-trideoxy-beta-L-altropyranose hydrolase [Alphaproteobacteria bacterium]|nr:UDP-2,4-diacetamido-2,4,6-trideoxy-beta-L-altropyranose hydrolase [Alphaproteobacteria bacterium]